ncbi:Ig-like domain-containing protein [Citrobacter youngae]|uniref:Big-1 domain-containing protein n=1 Tax=Citrobacter youngae ATCC 29220 TaxID=500640 RepID=D4BBZ7_9ENTR|nr:Ig-like domain-containing protein [Citrobacter youngae]EFE08615.1 hypothetical protein CIT292_07938 [Citrobacter youngae ATCC 29220]
MILADSDHIVAVHADPQVAVIPVSKVVTLTAAVADASGAPVSGVTVYWANTLPPVTLVTSETDSSGVATLEITLSSLPEGLGVYRYIAYLDSDISTSMQVDVRIADNTVSLPLVTDGGDLDLDKYDIANGVTVSIQAYAQASRGDQVSFYWDEIHSVSKFIDDPATFFPWNINVNEDLPPEALVDGTYTLYYQYTDSQGNIAVSLPRMETVSGGEPAATLPAADFPEADANNGYINARQALDGTPARLYWPGIAVNDTVTMTWMVYDQNGVQVAKDIALTGTVDAEDLKNNYLEILIPAADIPQGIQLGTAEAWYSMTPANGDTVKTSAVATIGIDTQA